MQYTITPTNFNCIYAKNTLLQFYTFSSGQKNRLSAWLNNQCLISLLHRAERLASFYQERPLRTTAASPN